MFTGKKCNKCGSKIKRDFNFCPFCGNHLKGNFKQDWGLLGRTDFGGEENLFELPIGKIFNNLFKNLSTQLNRLDDSPNKSDSKYGRNKGISISISTGGYPSKMRMGQVQNSSKRKELTPLEFPSKKLKEFSKLPKTEPLTNVRRLSDKLIYEMSIPGVNDLKDISITKLENGIEIKAVSKDKAYEKTIPISLPIIKRKFSNGKLILELDARD
jgi:HSP20 family molecular chaperone IbpA